MDGATADTQTVTVDLVKSQPLAFDAARSHANVTIYGGGIGAGVRAGVGNGAFVGVAQRGAVGKRYFEAVVTTSPSSGNQGIGIVSQTAPTDTYVGDPSGGAQGVAVYRSNSATYPSGGTVNGLGGNGPTGSTYMIAFDTVSRRIWFGRDGYWSGDPVAGTGGYGIPFTGAAYPAVSLNQGTSWEAKFTGTKYQPPQGFTYVP